MSSVRNRPLRSAALAVAFCLCFLHDVDAQTSSGTSSPLGPNVLVFTPGTSSTEMQAKIDQVYARQEHSEFGPGRYAFLFTPGTYKVDVPVGFYTQVVGLGPSPDDVQITGNVHADAALAKNNATTTFWRAAEGFSVTPAGGTMQWAVSQGVAFRRMHVLGDMALHQHRGWASGGWMSDTLVDGSVDSGSQQQWISRNVEWRAWTGSNWNMMFVGVDHPPKGDWPQPPYTKIAKTPVIREKPFLEVDRQGQYSIRVPALTHGSTGITWHTGATAGRTVPLSEFYVARPETDTAASMNRALNEGRNLLLTPGIYDLDQPLRVSHRDAVVFGLGFATLHPTHGTAAMTVADVDGVTISGLLFDAGAIASPALLQVGDRPVSTRHTANPVSLHDVFFRVGGAAEGKSIANLIINSNDVLIDHTWIWRADHGQGVGWTTNTSQNGLVVSGNHVTAYGLFVEHHQQYQVLWNGEDGRVFFYQSEIPYDPPDQASWTSAAGINGWASYKVGDKVKEHQAFGLGVYSVFRHSGVTLSHAIEVPNRPHILFQHMITAALDNLGEITHVIDDAGASARTGSPLITPKVDSFPR